MLWKSTMLKVFVSTFLLLCATVASDLTQEQKAYLAQKGTIKLCVDPDWYPFELVEEDGKYIGIAADLIALVKQNVNLNMELVATKDWNETLAFSKQRKCDVIGFLNETRERKEWLSFTKPLLSDPNVLIGRIENEYIDDLAAIEDAKAVLLRNTSVYERFVNEYPNIEVMTVESEAKAFEMVENKEADFTLRSMIISSHTIKEEGLFNLKIIAIPQGYENHLRMGVRNDEPILRDILNRSIQQITEEQKEEIINRYVTILIEKNMNYTVAFSIVASLVAVIIGVFVWNFTLQRKVNKEVEKNMLYEKELMRQKKDAEMGNLMASVSHQWRDGLSDVSSITMHLLTKVDFDVTISKEDIKKSANEIDRSIRFMSETMDSFLELYRPNKRSREVDIKNSIEAVLVILDAKIKQHNATVIINENEKTSVTGVKNYWMQVWLNLIINSLTAADKNKIQYPQIIIGVNEDKIIYQDSCGGMDKALLEAVKNGNADGLGMKIVDTMLEKMQLCFAIENNKDGVALTINL
ncbi:MAG: transporter substrate-binding domain-containing protein [Campylobacterota bacterium]